MNTKNLVAIAALALLTSSNMVLAATTTPTFVNSDDANTIYLWADNGQTSFNGATFLNAPMADWSTFVNTGTELHMAGSTVAAATGLFNVSINYNSTVRFQWAEVFWDAGVATIQSSGILSYRSNRGWRSHNGFNRAGDIVDPGLAVGAVPIPSSVVLLGSAMIGLMTLGRKGGGAEMTAGEALIQS